MECAAVTCTNWWFGERGAVSVVRVFTGPRAVQRAEEWVARQVHGDEVAYDVHEDVPVEEVQS